MARQNDRGAKQGDGQAGNRAGDRARKPRGGQDPSADQGHTDSPVSPLEGGQREGGDQRRYQPGHRNRVSDQGGNRGSNTPGQSRGGGAPGG